MAKRKADAIPCSAPCTLKADSDRIIAGLIASVDPREMVKRALRVGPQSSRVGRSTEHVPPPLLLMGASGFQLKLGVQDLLMVTADSNTTASYDLRKFDEVILLGAGKAAVPMAAEVLAILGERIKRGHIVTKYGHTAAQRPSDGPSLPCHSCSSSLGLGDTIEVTEAGHPIPDANGARGAQRIVDICTGAGERSLIVCVISGGASALLCKPTSRCPPSAATVGELKCPSGRPAQVRPRHH